MPVSARGRAWWCLPGGRAVRLWGCRRGSSAGEAAGDGGCRRRRRIAHGEGGADRVRGGFGGILVPGVDDGEGTAAVADVCAEAGNIGQPNRRIDRVLDAG